MKCNTILKDAIKRPNGIREITQLHDVSLVVYHNHKRLAECKPYYIGMFGVFIKDWNILYPANTRLEIEIIGSNNKNIDNQRFPVVISSVTSQGVGLKPDNFEPLHNIRWKTILNNVSILKNNLKDISEVSHKFEPIVGLVH